MNNINYVRDLSTNMQDLTADTSSINLINIDYDEFVANVDNLTGYIPIRLNNGGIVVGADLTIKGSENFTSQLDSNQKKSYMSDASTMGAINATMSGGFVNLQGQQGMSIGLVPKSTALAGALAMLGFQCYNSFDLMGKLTNEPFSSDELAEMICDNKSGQLIDIYDSVNGNVYLPKDSFCALCKYIRRVGWISGGGVDTRTGYYGLTKYNVLSVERDYKVSSYSGKYVPHQGVNIGTSATITFSYTYVSGNSYHDDVTVQSSSDIYMDFWVFGGNYFHVTFYSLNPINGGSSHLMIGDDRIYIYDWNSRTDKNDLISYTLTNWSGAESSSQMNFIDVYNQLKGSIDNAHSSSVEAVTNGVNTMAEIDENARFIINKMTDIGQGQWSDRNDGVTLDFTNFTATTPIYAYLVRYVNTDDYLNKINLVLCSLDSFSYREVSYYTDGSANSYSTRTSGSRTVDGHTFYTWSTENYIEGIECTLALPVVEYDCGGGSIPSNPIDPISDIVKWQLLNSTATDTDIGEGSSGTAEGLEQVGTLITLSDSDTSSNIWSKVTNALPSHRFRTNVLSVFTDQTNVIDHYDGIAIPLPTHLVENQIATINGIANNQETNYTGSGIYSAPVARIIGGTITEVGLTDGDIDKVNKVTYDIEKEQTPVQSTTVGIGNTPDINASVGHGSSMYTVYKLTQSELDSFGSWLWTSDFFTQVQQAWDNPMENIISLNKVYCDLPTGANTSVYIGRIDSGVACQKMNDRYITMNLGSVNINEYFGNMLDYSPYTDIQMYLPFIGIVRIDNNDVMRGTVTLTYRVDIFTGDLLAIISVKRDSVNQVAYQFNGNCAVAYPYSASSTFKSTLQQISGLGSMIGGVAMAVGTGGLGAVGMIGAGAVTASTAKTDVAHSGNMSGSVGVLGSRTPYIIITRPQVVSTDLNKKYVGVANNIVDKISNHTGFIKVTEPQIKTVAFKSEVEMIKNELERGVLV